MFTFSESINWNQDARSLAPQVIGQGLSYKNVSIHQAENPEGEALSWIEEAGPPRETNFILVFGLGLGWHLKVLRQKFPLAKIVVYEPSEELLDVYRLKGLNPEGEPAHINTSWPDMENIISHEMVYDEKARPFVFTVPGYAQIWPEAAGSFEQFIGMAAMRRAVIEKTRYSTGEKFMDNLAENLGRVLALPDLMSLKGRLPRRPAFIVGSGPSLDQNAHLLADVGRRALIIAASSALKPLLAQGVSPDVVLTLEASDTSGFLILSEEEEKRLKPETILALAAGCHPNHFKVEGYHRAIFHLSKGEAQILGNGLYLPQGGNAGTAAFSLAYFWGLGPLILVGQDQAYRGDHLHASQTPGGVVETERDPGIMVRGVDEGFAETHTGLLASLSWFAETAKSVKAAPNPPALYNASAAGAKVPGFTEIPLKSILAALPPMAEQINLSAALPKLPRPDIQEVRGDLEQIAGLINTLRRFAKMDGRKAAEEIKNIGQVSAFMGQLLGPASVAQSNLERIKALEKVDMFLTRMLMAFN